MKKGKINVGSIERFGVRFWEGVAQALTITLVSALLMSASNQNDRITTLEAITMDKLEIVERLNELEKNIDGRLDDVESSQKVMLEILRSLKRK